MPVSNAKGFGGGGSGGITSYPIQGIGSGYGVYYSPIDFGSSYNGADSILLDANIDAISPNSSQFLSVVRTTSAGVSTIYNDGFSYNSSTKVLTVTGAAFTATDVFKVFVLGQMKGYNEGEAAYRNGEISPLDEHYLPQSLVDTTNLAVATHYFPGATGGLVGAYNSIITWTGKLTDADETLTLTLEVTNDEDTAAADWKAIQFTDKNTGSLVSSITITNGTATFAISAEKMTFSYYRIVVVAGGATNTVIVKEKRASLA